MGIRASYKTDLTEDWSDYFSAYSSGNRTTPLSFTNSYEASASTDLTAYKSMTGRELAAGEFTFLLEALSDGAPLPDGEMTADADDAYGEAEGTRYVAVSNAADGSVSFGNATYTQADIGKTYTYRVVEIVGELGGVTYNTAAYGKLIYVKVEDNEDGTLKLTVTTSGSEDMDGDGVNDVVIYNSFERGTVSISGTKTWVDGNKEHDNAEEVELTLYDSTDGGSTWTEYTETEYEVSWGTADTSKWTIANLPQYSASGETMTYKVEETAVSGYTTAYDDNDLLAITNTIEQEEVTLTGDKTWVEPTETAHDNAAELTLLVYRESTGTGAAKLLVSSDEYTVTWADDAYTITGLDKYDSLGYTYNYFVEESYSDACSTAYAKYTSSYTTEKDSCGYTVYHFTNRAPDEEPTDPTKAITEGTVTVTVNGVETAMVEVGSTLTYTITYRNYANMAQTVTVTDTLPTSLVYVSSQIDGADAAPAISNNGQTLVWTITDVPAFTSGTVTVTVTVTEAALTDGTANPTLTNTAAVQIGSETEQTASSEDPVGNPSLTVEKTVTSTPANGSTYAIGETVTYSLKVTNTGNVPITDIVLTDDKTGDSFEIGTLEPGASVEKTVTYTVTESDSETGFVTNTATASGKDPDGDDVTDTDEETVDIRTYGSGSDGSLSITKVISVSGDATDAMNADTFSFTVVGPSDLYTALNGGSTSGSVTVSYTIDSGAAQTAAVDSETNSFTITGVKNGQTVTVTTALPTGDYTVTETAASGNTYTYTASIKGESTGSMASGSQTNGGTASGAAAQTLTKDDTVSYTATNTPETTSVKVTKSWVDGDGNALDESLIPNGEAITVTLAGTAFTAGTATITGTYSAAGTLTADDWEYTFENLPLTDGSGNTYSYTVTESEVEGFTAENAKVTAEANTDGSDGYTAALVNVKDSETATDPVKTNDAATVTVTTESGDVQMVEVGTQFTYTITYKNNTNKAADVTITDVLPDGLKYVSSDPEAAVNGRTVVWVIEDVAPFTGGSVTVTVEVTEDALESADSNPEIENVATIQVGSENEQTADDTIEVYDPSLSIVKTVTNQDPDYMPKLGETVEYAITVTNDGNVTITDITVTDDLTGLSGENAATIASLAPGESATFTTSYVITEEDVVRGYVKNVVTAEGTDSEGEPVTDTDTVTVPQTADPSFTVTKETVSTSASTEGYALGEVIQYKITVINTGNVTIHDVTVTDELIGASGDNVLSFGTIKPGETSSLYVSYVVTEEDVTAGSVTNEVTANAKDPFETALPSATAEVTDPVRSYGASGGMTITKTITSASGTVTDEMAKDTFDFTVTGPDDLYEIIKSVGYVVEYQINSGDTRTARVSRDDTFTITDVKHGDTVTILTMLPTGTYTVTETASDGNTYYYEVSITSTASTVSTAAAGEDNGSETGASGSSETAGAAAVLAENGTIAFTAFNTPVAASVAVTKAWVDGDGNALDPDLILTEETITVTLAGLATAETGTGIVTVTASYSASGTLTADSWDYTFENLPLMDASGNAYVYTVTEAEVEGFTETSGGTVTAAEENGVLTVSFENEKDSEDPVEPQKTNDAETVTVPTEDGDVEMVTVGTQFTYTITYTNNTNKEQTVTVTDTLPAGLEYISSQVNGADAEPAQDGQTLIWTISNAAPFTSGAVTVTVEVTEDALSGDESDPLITNTATVQIGSETAQTAEDTIEIYNPDWTVEKTVSGMSGEIDEATSVQAAAVGDTLTYTITITNTGNVPITKTVTDTFTVDGEEAELELSAASGSTSGGTAGNMSGGTTGGTAGNTSGGTSGASYDAAAKTVTLAAGESIVLTATYTVTSTDNTLVNAVTVGSEDDLDPDDPDAELPGDTVTTEVKDYEAWTVTKTVSGMSGGTDTATGIQSAVVGDTLTYIITIVNTGNVSITKPVNDTFTVDNEEAILDLNVVSCTASDGTPGTGSYDAAAKTVTLAEGETIVLTAAYTVTSTDNTLVNTVVVGDDDDTAPDDPGAEPPGDTVTTEVEDKASMLVSKDADGTIDYMVGDTVVYTITVENTGNCTITDVVVTDSLAGAVFVAGEGYTVDPDGKTATIASLAECAVVTLTVTYTVSESDLTVNEESGEGEIEVYNKATASGEDPEGNTVTDSGDVWVPYEKMNPSWTVTKTVSGMTGEVDEMTGEQKAVVGDTLVYTITVENTGNVIIKKVLTDIFTVDGEEVTLFLSKESGDGTYDRASGLVTLDVGETIVLTAEYEVTSTDITLVNMVTVGSEDDLDPDDPDAELPGDTVTTEVEDVPVMILIKETTSTPADGVAYALGETITYRLTLTNLGNVTITNIVVEDVLTGNSGENAWTVESLAPGESVVFTTSYIVTEADILAGSVVNQATASGTVPSGDTDTPYDSDGEVTPVTPEDSEDGRTEDPTQDPDAIMTLVKETTSTPADGKAYAPGEVITYKITVTNVGNLTLTNVIVEDELTGNSGENAWTVDSLAPGESAEFTTSYTVTEADALAGSVVNEAGASAEAPSIESSEEEESSDEDAGNTVTPSDPEDGIREDPTKASPEASTEETTEASTEEPSKETSEETTAEASTEDTEASTDVQDAPQTGDETPLLPYMMLMMCASGILLAGGARRKRRRRSRM
ncbi:MAG: DUF11 domain-containing protein, partial [Lachnospiraceae bacterium]|nr:DUF11 domain-containing protein [Lachnospiraceae bacterium]